MFGRKRVEVPKPKKEWVPPEPGFLEDYGFRRINEHAMYDASPPGISWVDARFCVVCGALVHVKDVELHRGWHER